MFEDHYKALRLRRDASPDEIKKAFYELAAKCHPDHNPGDESAKEKFQRINRAFEVLGDKQQREKYNRLYDAKFTTVQQAPTPAQPSPVARPWTTNSAAPPPPTAWSSASSSAWSVQPPRNPSWLVALFVIGGLVGLVAVGFIRDRIRQNNVQTVAQEPSRIKQETAKPQRETANPQPQRETDTTQPQLQPIETAPQMPEERSTITAGKLLNSNEKSLLDEPATFPQPIAPVPEASARDQPTGSPSINRVPGRLTLDELRLQLEAPESGRRVRIVKELGKRGAEGIPVLTERLDTEPFLEVRMAILESLGEFGPTAIEAFEKLAAYHQEEKVFDLAATAATAMLKIDSTSDKTKSAFLPLVTASSDLIVRPVEGPLHKCRITACGLAKHGSGATWAEPKLREIVELSFRYPEHIYSLTSLRAALSAIENLDQVSSVTMKKLATLALRNVKVRLPFRLERLKEATYLSYISLVQKHGAPN